MVAGEIKEAVDWGKADYNDYAILYRTNAQSSVNPLILDTALDNPGISSISSNASQMTVRNWKRSDVCVMLPLPVR